MCVFLSASLPELIFGQAPPLTLAEFDELAAEVLPAERCRELARLKLPLNRASTDDLPLSVQRQFCAFERFLRTGISALRAKALEWEYSVPALEAFFPEAERTLGEAAKISNPVEREELVDRLRWSFLDELESGHNMDLEHLCVYRIRLQILSGYRERDFTDGQKRFQAVLDRMSNRQ